MSVGEKLQKEVKVGTSVLKQYVGVYETDPKRKAIITLENGRLQIEADPGGLPKSPLFAKSENIFFLKVIEAEIEFVKDNNKVIQLIVHFNGQNQVAKKVKLLQRELKKFWPKYKIANCQLDITEQIPIIALHEPICRCQNNYSPLNFLNNYLLASCTSHHPLLSSR